MEMDRLISLPDPLLFNILNRLGRKEATKTAVLSKQMRSFVLTNLPFRFQDTSKEIDKVQAFVARIHAALAAGLALDRLYVSFYYHDRFAPDVDAWLDFAAKKKFEKISLYLRRDYRDRGPRRYTLPQLMYSNSSVKELHLENCVVSPQTAVGWPRLKTLSMNDTKFMTQEEMEEILSGCPNLRTLELSFDDGIERLMMWGRRFRDLMTYVEIGKKLYDFSEPYMQDFAEISVRGSCKVQLDKKALLEIPHWRSGRDEVMRSTFRLFQDLRHVSSRTLRLSVNCAKVVSMMATNGWRLPQLRLKELHIGIGSDVHNIYGVVVMLDSSPCLEKLVIKFERYKPLHKHGEELIMVDWGPITRDDLEDDMLQLKTVEFREYEVGSDLCGEFVLTLGQIVLKRAPVLEEIVIVKRSSSPTQEIDSIKKKMLNYPKSSQKVSVEIRW